MLERDKEEDLDSDDLICKQHRLNNNKPIIIKSMVNSDLKHEDANNRERLRSLIELGRILVHRYIAQESRLFFLFVVAKTPPSHGAPHVFT